MLYCSLYMVHNGCNCYFSFWAIFCPFTSLTARKIKIYKNWKKHVEKSSFYNRFPKIMIILLYCCWVMVRDGCNYFSFWAVFCPFTLLTAQKIKLKKNEKNTQTYYHFTQVYQKPCSFAIMFLKYGAWQM